MLYCEIINLWWVIFLEGEGLYCYFCRKYDIMNIYNKIKIFNKDLSKRICLEVFIDYCKIV